MIVCVGIYLDIDTYFRGGLVWRAFRTKQGRAVYVINNSFSWVRQILVLVVTRKHKTRRIYQAFWNSDLLNVLAATNGEWKKKKEKNSLAWKRSIHLFLSDSNIKYLFTCILHKWRRCVRNSSTQSHTKKWRSHTEWITGRCGLSQPPTIDRFEHVC